MYLYVKNKAFTSLLYRQRFKTLVSGRKNGLFSVFNYDYCDTLMTREHRLVHLSTHSATAAFVTENSLFLTVS